TSRPRVATLGRSISRPPCRNGAVTMKMISSTRITSTSGVTLISAIGIREPPRFMLIGSRSLQRLGAPIDELARELRGVARELAQPSDEVVVRDHRRDRSGQPRDGRDQRL